MKAPYGDHSMVSSDLTSKYSSRLKELARSKHSRDCMGRLLTFPAIWVAWQNFRGTNNLTYFNNLWVDSVPFPNILKILLKTNTPAYFALPSATKKKKNVWSINTRLNKKFLWFLKTLLNVDVVLEKCFPEINGFFSFFVSSLVPQNNKLVPLSLFQPRQIPSP